MTRPYSCRFRNLHPRVVRRTRDLVKKKPWARNPREQLELARGWVADVSEIYRVEPPTVARGFGYGYGLYNLEIDVIVLGTRRPFSVVTLLHEYRHALQARGFAPVEEPDARAWSLSLFRRAAPRRFARMARDGRLLFTTAREGSR